jgi:hypothetical protein
METSLIQPLFAFEDGGLRTTLLHWINHATKILVVWTTTHTLVIVTFDVEASVIISQSCLVCGEIVLHSNLLG